MTDLPTIALLAFGGAIGFLLCVLLWIAFEGYRQHRLSRDPIISAAVLEEARRIRKGAA
jgi:hypothetical protein